MAATELTIHHDAKGNRLLLEHLETPALVTASLFAPLSTEDARELLDQGGFARHFKATGCLGLVFGDEPGDPDRQARIRPTVAIFVTQHQVLGTAFDSQLCRVKELEFVQLTPDALCSEFAILRASFIDTLFSLGPYDISLPLQQFYAPDEQMQSHHRELFCANLPLFRHLPVEPVLSRNLFLRTFRGFAHVLDPSSASTSELPSSAAQALGIKALLVGRMALLPSPSSPSVVELETCLFSPTSCCSRLEVILTPCEGIGSGQHGSSTHSVIANPIAAATLHRVQGLYHQLMVVRTVAAPALAVALDDISKHRGSDAAKQRGNAVFDATDQAVDKLADLAELGAFRFGHLHVALADRTVSQRQEGILCTIGPLPSEPVLQRTAAALLKPYVQSLSAATGAAIDPPLVGTLAASVAHQQRERICLLPRTAQWALPAAGGRSKIDPRNVMAATDALSGAFAFVSLPAWDAAAATATVRQAVELSATHELIVVAIEAPATAWSPLLAVAPVGFATAAAVFSDRLCVLVLCQAEALSSVADVRVAATHTPSLAVAATFQWRARPVIIAAVSGSTSLHPANQSSPTPPDLSAARAVVTALYPFDHTLLNATEIFVLAETHTSIRLPVAHLSSALRALIAHDNTATLATHGAPPPTLKHTSACVQQLVVPLEPAVPTITAPRDVGVAAVWKQLFTPAGTLEPPKSTLRTLPPPNDSQLVVSVTAAAHAPPQREPIRLVIGWPQARSSAMAALTTLGLAPEIDTGSFGIVRVTSTVRSRVYTYLCSHPHTCTHTQVPADACGRWRPSCRRCCRANVLCAAAWTTTASRRAGRPCRPPACARSAACCLRSEGEEGGRVGGFFLFT
jgi:uncharacterized membrane protein YgdD (TMEM256/DUF423 family)